MCKLNIIKKIRKAYKRKLVKYQYQNLSIEEKEKQHQYDCESNKNL